MYTDVEAEGDIYPLDHELDDRELAPSEPYDVDV